MGFLSYEKSIELLDALDAGVLRKENVFLNDALGRYLAEDLVADENSPSQPTSANGGYEILHSSVSS